MSHRPRCFSLMVIGSLALTTLLCTEGLSEETTLIRVGPRIGLSGPTFLGKEQKHDFQLYDIAAVFRLPWLWEFGQSGWRLETRLMTSAGLLVAAGDSSLMATIVPGLAVTNGTVFLDVGLGPAFFSSYKFGDQNFGGPVQLAVTAGVGVNLFSHAYAGFRVQHFSDAGLYSGSSLGVDMYVLDLSYRF